jgi:hypothetical protein
MNFAYCLAQLSHNAKKIQHLVAMVSPEQATWKPDNESWSVLEVVHHLYDEEQFDFRVRLDFILHKPDQPWPKIDPQGWVLGRAYNQQKLPDILTRFLAERANSLEWLAGLSGANWETSYVAPFGPIRTGDMLAAWVGHDLLHIRQLIELEWYYTGHNLTGFSTRYAGPW